MDKIEVTMADVEDQLVECHELWRRSPGAGKRPFAGDGPWELLQPEAGDYGGDGADGASSSERPRAPLDAAEVGLRDRLTAQLQWIEDLTDRRIVWLVAGSLAHDVGRVPWKELKRWINWERSQNALAYRYNRGLASIVCRLNRWPTRRIAGLAAEGVVRERAQDAA